MSATGVEPVTFGSGGRRPVYPTGCNLNALHDDIPAMVAPVVADQVETTPADPDLVRLIEAWPRLPEAVRAGIVAMLNATLKG